MSSLVSGSSRYGPADVMAPKMMSLHITGIHGWEDLDTKDPINSEDLWIGLSRSAVGTYFKPGEKYELSIRTVNPDMRPIPVSVTTKGEKGYLFSEGADLRRLDSARYGLSVLGEWQDLNREVPLYTGDMFVRGGVPEILGITPKRISGPNVALVCIKVRNGGECKGRIVIHDEREDLKTERFVIGSRQYGTHQEFFFDSTGLNPGDYTIQYRDCEDTESSNAASLHIK